ncbi:M48 family metallopeptidase [Salininema proteolyticum]|uniref:M48 family metallopeptidase n=1 Tax=Salininema proteolyticum TaxID=1607685 RepID=A0ABV8TYW3_9ACTN
MSLPSESARSAAGRATVGFLLLCGFYVVALAVAGVVGLLAYLVFQNSSSLGTTKAVYAAAALVAVIAGALWRSLRVPPFAPKGVAVTREEAPELWAEVEELAREADTRPPDEIRLDADFNAGVVEEAKALGLLGGRRHLSIGLPLALCLNASQLRAVLAHELGHFSASHTRLGVVNMRGGYAVGLLLRALRSRPYNPATWVFKGYALFYSAVSNAIRRSQELEADRIAAVAAGSSAMRSALRDMEAYSAGWQVFLSDYLHWSMAAGVRPKEPLSGFPLLVEARSTAIDAFYESRMREQRTGCHDSHPATLTRIAVLAGLPDGERAVDERPATALIDDFPVRRAEVERDWLGDESSALDWETAGAEAMDRRTAEAADRAYRALARAGGKEGATFDDFLTALEEASSRGPLAVEEYLDHLRTHHFPDEGAAALIARTARESGAMRYRLRWDAGIDAVGADGEPFPVEELAAVALDAGRGEAASLRPYLEALGVDVAKGVPSEGDTTAEATKERAELVAGLHRAKLGRKDVHLFVATTGLLFLPFARGLGRGDEELRILVDRAGSLRALAERDGAVWLPYEEIVSADMKLRLHLHVTFTTYDGRSFTVREKESGNDRIGDPVEVLGQLAVRHA